MNALKTYTAGAAEIGPGENDKSLRSPTPMRAAPFGADGAARAVIDLARDRFEPVNARCRELLALDGEGLAALGLADLMSARERAAMYDALGEAGRWEGAWTYRRGGAAPVWLQAAVTVWRRDESGAPTHALVVMLDVSEQGRSLERLRASEDASHQGQRASGLALFSREFTTDVVAFSAATRALFGLSSGETEVSFSDALLRMAPMDAPRLRAAIEANLARRGKDFRAEFSFLRASDGQKRDIELRVAYEYDASGHPLRSVGAAIDVTDRSPAPMRLAFAGGLDPLTGLCNRPAFLEHLAEACLYAAPDAPVAVLRLDLDRWRDACDAHGLAFGELLLVQIGRRLSGQLRGVDRLARLGDDGFALLLTGLHEPEDAGLLARRLIARLREPFMIEGQRILVRASIGVAVAPHDSLAAEDLLRSADLALAEAKADAQDSVRYFDAGMNAQAVARHQLESDLRRAVKNGEFELFYQPMLGMQDLRIMKFEALIRWRDPVKGLITPDSFIPACERNGMICQIGDWVLQQACADAATWPDDIGVAVNVSAVQVARGDLDRRVAAALTASGVRADRLEIEITETALLNNTEATLETLRKVKALGVRLAMDDFGVGYASLGYLQQFPFDKVKIDRSFTREVAVSPQGAARLKAILDLCAAFNLATTIEGVETQVQLDALTRLGGTKFQGFLFSPPRPADCVPGLIESFGGGAGST